MAGRDYEILKAQVEESIRKSHFKPSKQMKEVLNALKSVCDLRGQPVTDDLKMIEAHERLGKACEAYTNSRQDAKSEKGQTRLGLVGAIHHLQKEEQEGINAMRSPKARRENQHKTWNDVLASQRERTIDVTDQHVKKVGGGSSTRYVVEMDGKKGYFTEQQNLITISERMENCAKKAVHPEVRDALLRGVELANSPVNDIDTVASTASACNGEPDFRASFTQVLNEEKYKDTKSLFGYENFSEPAKTEFFNFMSDIGKQYTALDAMEGSANISIGANITNRNIATSRLAELLGQENLIANSQRLCIHTADGDLHGVVMDQAIGKDIRSSDPIDKMELSQIADFSDPEFQRQVANLEIMDILSGQVDRNMGNMFYQFSDAIDGKRRLTGIQGIDNDAAFGLNDISRASREMVALNEVTMIDAGLNENLMKLNRNVLDYTFGDILRPEEIEAMDNRLVQIKDHVLNDGVKIMQPDEWSKETAQQLDSRHRYMDTIKTGIEEVKAGLEKEAVSASKEKPKARKERQLEEPETAAHEKADVEKAPTESSAKPEKADPESEKQMETQKPEKHERKEIPLNDLEDMVKSDRKMENAQKEKEAPKADHQWERRSPSVPLNTGRRLHGELGIGQHHRTPGGPSR